MEQRIWNSRVLPSATKGSSESRLFTGVYCRRSLSLSQPVEYVKTVGIDDAALVVAVETALVDDPLGETPVLDNSPLRAETLSLSLAA